jgi:TM2 domain-containing membrane protein YozV
MVFMNAGGGASSAAVAVAPMVAALRRYSKGTAALLAFMLGGFGAHKFYLGQTFQGILYLLFCWTGIPLILGIIESICYLSHSESQWLNRYCA